MKLFLRRVRCPKVGDLMGVKLEAVLTLGRQMLEVFGVLKKII
jgi:hypothetical protein